jgi:exosome complex RNA-binding protein Rrp42 (RNase PH superfamily)
MWLVWATILVICIGGFLFSAMLFFFGAAGEEQRVNKAIKQAQQETQNETANIKS